MLNTLALCLTVLNSSLTPAGSELQAPCFEPSRVTSYDDLMQYIVKTSSGYACCCGSFAHKWKMNVQNHVESIHFPGHFTWNCEVCGEEAKTRNILAKHKTKFHPKNPPSSLLFPPQFKLQ